MDMNNKLDVLKELTGNDFVEIDARHFKSKTGDAIILETDDEVADYIKDSVYDEIPYLDNELLKKYLPEKFNNDFILNEYKELCKFDHTLLSNLITDKLNFVYSVMGQYLLSDLVLMDSEVDRVGDYWVFYLKHDD